MKVTLRFTCEAADAAQFRAQAAESGHSLGDELGMLLADYRKKFEDLEDALAELKRLRIKYGEPLPEDLIV